MCSGMMFTLQLHLRACGHNHSVILVVREQRHWACWEGGEGHLEVDGEGRKKGIFEVCSRKCAFLN